jgi:hypothetical protein
MPALPRVPTVQLWHSEVPTLAKAILPDAVQRMDHARCGSYSRNPIRTVTSDFVLADYAPKTSSLAGDAIIAFRARNRNAYGFITSTWTSAKPAFLRRSGNVHGSTTTIVSRK